MTDKNDIFLSVILAAFDVEPYVARCLDSVVNTGDPQVEVLVVLGNSKDRTNEICMEYEKRGLAVCIMQDGKGLSNARNCGIRRAQGIYLTFADADDWMDTKRFAAFIRYLKRMLRKSPRCGDYDVLINDFIFADDSGRALFGNRQIWKLKKRFAHARTRSLKKTSGGRKKRTSLAQSDGIDFTAGSVKSDGIDFTTALVQSGGTFWNAWRYVYRTAYLKEKGRSFMENCCCEDLEFAVRTLLDTRRTAYLHWPYYYYCPVRPQSLMNSKNLKMLQDFWTVERYLLRLCAEQETALSRAVTEKLKELLVLNLPDIREADKKERRAAVRGYQKLLREIKRPEKRWVRGIVYLCRMGGLVPVSNLLYRIRKLRRMIKYRQLFGGLRQLRKENTDKDRSGKGDFGC